MQKRYSPMLAFPAKPFDSPDYVFEVKYDGTRAIAYADNNTVTMINRRDNRIEGRYPEFADLRNHLNIKKSAVLDGEVVVFRDGKPDFPLLQTREHGADPFRIRLLSRQHPATYVVFDILELDGDDLTKMPLIQRKELLRRVLIESESIVFSEYVEGRGKAFFAEAKRAGLEGVMAKRKDSLYTQDRSRFWLKMKAVMTMDCVICGYTRGFGWRGRTFGSLVLGAYRDGKLRYVGKAGSGFTEESLREVLDVLKGHESGNSPFGEPHGVDDEVAGWLRPELVCEVEFLLLTKTLKLRAPVFKRMRTDKRPEDCII